MPIHNDVSGRAVCRKIIRKGSLKWGADIETSNASRGWDWRRGVPLPSRLGFWGASWAPPAGSGAEPRPQTPFQHFLSVTERFRWKENEILLHYVVTDKVEKFPDEHFGQCISRQCWQLQLYRFAEIELKIFWGEHFRGLIPYTRLNTALVSGSRDCDLFRFLIPNKKFTSWNHIWSLVQHLVAGFSVDIATNTIQLDSCSVFHSPYQKAHWIFSPHY